MATHILLLVFRLSPEATVRELWIDLSVVMFLIALIWPYLPIFRILIILATFVNGIVKIWYFDRTVFHVFQLH